MASKNEAYAIYFCAETLEKYAGEGAQALAEYRKATKGKPYPSTVVDNSMVMAELKKAGVSEYVKIVVSATNAAAVKKYGAGANTMLICAPDGTRLQAYCGDQCTQANILKGTKGLKDLLAAWKVQAGKKKKG